MLELQNISLGYGKQTILTDINLSARRGEMLGIIGPNGSGKSTMIKGICRLIPPQKGRVLIDGQDVAHISREELARLAAVVPQTPNLPDTFTAFEIVLMGRTPHLGRFRFEGPSDFEAAWHAMKITRTQSIAERRMDEISGGQKQLLTIARALAQESTLILLDEPTAHLDINYQIATLDFIRELCAKQNLAAVTVLHDLNLASQYCNRLALLSNGRIHIEGTPQEVITEEHIKQVYGASVCVYPHPVNNLPTTAVLPGKGSKAGG
ncbi:MAG: ABC transporter ATP-binding protein [Chloroflexota bacterium]|nr:ABC transporter ATP-binding protein [Chloroflexota bacterium]